MEVTVQTLWTTVFAVFILVAVTAGGYAVHRLCLWLEGRGWLYYIHRKPSGSPASAFVALQKVLEPPSQHVQQVKAQEQRGDHPAGNK
jgi:hypothetical protein